MAQIAMTYALKLAPVSVVSPFEYTQIDWAVQFGLALWGAPPSSSPPASTSYSEAAPIAEAGDGKLGQAVCDGDSYRGLPFNCRKP